MAKEEEREEGEGKEASKGKSKKKLILIIGIVLILLVGGVGAFLAMKGSKAKEGGGENDEEASAEEGSGGEGKEEGGELPGAMVPLETFIVNLQVKGSFLKTAIQLEFAEPEAPPSLESQVPKIRDAILRLLSGKQASEILTSDGKEKIKEEIKQAVNNALGGEDVIQVYFTEFIVQ